MNTPKVNPRWFLVPIVLLSLGAAGSFALSGNYRMAFYWVSISLVNFAAMLIS